MTMQQSLSRVDNRRPETHEPMSSAGPGGENPLLTQAGGFSKVAQKANEDCEKGEAAERQLEKRRNRSGQ